jgi:hypothetical protein
VNIERLKARIALFRTNFFKFLLFNLFMRYYWLEWMLPFHVVNLVLGASTWIFFGKSFQEASPIYQAVRWGLRFLPHSRVDAQQPLHIHP